MGHLEQNGCGQLRNQLSNISEINPWVTTAPIHTCDIRCCFWLPGAAVGGGKAAWEEVMLAESFAMAIGRSCKVKWTCLSLLELQIHRGRASNRHRI